MKIKLVLTLIISCLVSMAFSQSAKLTKKAHLDAEKIMPKVIEWRHDIHEHPELSNLEFKTAAKVAQHLKDLGLESRGRSSQNGRRRYFSRRPARASDCLEGRYGWPSCDRKGGTPMGLKGDLHI